MQIIKEFKSRRNKVLLIKDNSKIFVRKEFHNVDNFENELRALELLQTIRVPKIIRYSNLSIDTEYISGKVLLEKYTNADDTEMIELAKALATFIKSFMLVAKDKILYDLNFRNFIIKDNICYGIDFEEVNKGELSLSLAKVIAFARSYNVVSHLQKIFCQTLLNELGYDYENIKQLVEKEQHFLKNRWAEKRDTL